VTDVVPTEDIERIVGAPRAPYDHLGRAVSEEETVYILHSKECLDSGIDLRECRFSKALDNGIDLDDWTHREDAPMVLRVLGYRVVPLSRVT
jgi:hypothetical protein